MRKWTFSVACQYKLFCYPLSLPYIKKHILCTTEKSVIPHRRYVYFYPITKGAFPLFRFMSAPQARVLSFKGIPKGMLFLFCGGKLMKRVIGRFLIYALWRESCALKYMGAVGAAASRENARRSRSIFQMCGTATHLTCALLRRHRCGSPPPLYRPPESKSTISPPQSQELLSSKAPHTRLSCDLPRSHPEGK